MSLLDIIPKEFQQFFPFLKRKKERQELENRLNNLQEKLAKKKEKSDDENSEEAEDSDDSPLVDSIEEMKKLISESESPWYKRLIKIGLYLAPIVLSYFLAIYLQSSNGLQLNGQEIINPIGFYELNEDDSSTFVLSENYKEHFWSEFPAYYFTPSYYRDGFDQQYFFFDQNKDSHIELKLILNNSSKNFPLMISTLHAEVSKVSEKPFPWERLNTTPQLERSTEGEFTEISNTGSAPAIDPFVKYHLPQDKSVESSFGPLYANQSFDFENIPYLDGYNLMGVQDNSGLLDSSYYILHVNRPRNSQHTYETFNGYVFRVINTPEDLKDVTEVIEVNSIDMTLEYESVTGELFEVKWKTQLESPIYYYVYSNNFFTRREAEIYPEKMYQYEDQKYIRYPEDKMSSLLDEIYTGLGNEPEFHPEGVSLIKETITIDLKEMTLGGSKSNLINPDQILNPEGYVIINLKLENASNGKYKVRLNANSEFVSEVFIETLIPEETEFQYPESLEYFREE